MVYRFTRPVILLLFIVSFASFSQTVDDPLPYAPIANPLPDTLDQLYRDTLNLIFSPIRINQAGYRPQDKKYFYYVGGGASSFTVIDQTGTEVGSGTLQATGQTCSGQLSIRASNNAQLVGGGDTRYIVDSPVYSGPLSEGKIPDLPPGVYQVVVGAEKSHPFVIDERVYSWVRDALLKFYGVNRCGDSQSWFHPACHLLDEVTGGWHDCGDHLKEGATMSYTAAVLGLAAAAFFDRDMDMYSANQSITQVTDGIPDILYEAKHGADFVLQSYDKAGGQVGTMVTSIGGFGNPGCGDDHMWWGRPEYQDKVPPDRGGPPRCVRSEPTSDYLAKYAANLAFVSRQYRPYDAAYADRCLEAAKAIYDYTKGRRDMTNTSAYNGSTICSDDLAFGCLALLWATEEREYLDELCFDQTIGTKASAGMTALFEGGWFTYNDPIFSKTTANTDWASVQTHVLWGFFRLILEDEELCVRLGLTDHERLKLIEKTVYNLIANLGSVGLGTQAIQLPDAQLWTPSEVKYGLPWFTMHTQMEWVWNRYQCGNITDMYYYYDIASRIRGLELPNTPGSTDWKAEEVKEVLVRMLDYQFGVNPWDISMVYGVGEKNFNHPHHRAANPEGKNVPGAFYSYRPPVGALQGGYTPTTSLYEEHYDDYFHSETGIDGTTNLLMPVAGLAKEDTLGAPGGTVSICYVGCDSAVIDVHQDRYGSATINYGIDGATNMKKSSDFDTVTHRITLTGLQHGTVYTFNVTVADLFGRDSVLKYLDEDKNLVDFSFTTLPTCPTDAEISSVKVCRVTYDSVEIFWFTPNGKFDSRVVYGEQVPPTTIHEGDIAGLPTDLHHVRIGGLTEQTTYYFYVESGDARDDNNGQLYEFTTPVEHVDFDIRTILYSWSDMPAMGMNIVNQDRKAYDSLDVRIYFRAEEGFEDDLGARLDIGIVYKEDGYQEAMGENAAIRENLMRSRPVKMEDTYDPTDQTYAYYFSVPLWGVEMHSGSRIRLDIIFDRRSHFPPYEDLMNQAPEHVITDRDWSFGPHSSENGDPVDFPGVPEQLKEEVDTDYWNQPINYYVTVYRKGEYIWGYSPSQEEMKTKKTHYTLESQVTDPLRNPSAVHVFYERPVGIVDVSGWAKVEPVDGTLNEIWIGSDKSVDKIEDLSSVVTWNESEEKYDFTIPVPVKNGTNTMKILLFAGPAAACEECYGCAESDHVFVVEFQGAKQYPSMLLLRDLQDQPLPSDTVKLDTTVFHVRLMDRNGNVNGQAPDYVTVWIKNFDNGDSLELSLVETGDSTGVFQTATPISVVDRTPDQTGPQEIALNGGDRVRIWYIDPTDETDSSEVYITSKATFPMARSGYLRDTDGDGAVDLITVRYSIALKELPDSIGIDFPSGASTVTLRAGADAMNFTENTVSVVPVQPFTVGVTGFSSALYGAGRSYLTYNSMVKESDFQVDDSIGPVCVGRALVNERLEPGFDTLTFTTSEALRLVTFVGEVLMLRRGGTDHPLQVQGIMASNGNTMTLIVDAGGLQFAAGDSLRFNPVTSVMDLAGNIPHTANRPVPVVIKASIPRVEYAFYYDLDCNGVLDVVRMGFNKPVNPGQLAIGFRWNTQQTILVDNTTISFADETASEMLIPLTSELTQDLVNTGGTLFNVLSHIDVPGDTVVTMVEDKAAPVISTAQFFLYSGEMLTNTATDTLLVTFSEPVTDESVTAITRFPLYSNERSTGYAFNVTGSYKLSQKEYRFYGSVTIVPFPTVGDSIWLDPVSAVSDAAQNSQTSPGNRHVAVIVGDVSASLNDVEITVSPNPVIIRGPYADSAAVIKLIPKNMRFEIQIDSSARAVIYDKVGNRITDLTSRSVPGGAEIVWNGTNNNHRYVGTGTYLCFVYFMGEKRSVMIGVRRR